MFKAGIAAGGRQRKEFSYSFIPLFTTKVSKKSRPFLEGTFCRAPHSRGFIGMGGDFGLSSVQDKLKQDHLEKRQDFKQMQKNPTFSKNEKMGHPHPNSSRLVKPAPPAVGRFFACALRWRESSRSLRSKVRDRVPSANARTSESDPSLRCPPVPVPANPGRTPALHRSRDPDAAREAVLRSLVGHGNLLVACVKITSYNYHCSAPFFRALVVSATKSTRRKEPTTSSNQPDHPPERDPIVLLDSSQ